MTPRSLDWRSVHPKVRKIEELVEALEALGPIDAARLRSEITTALAVDHYRRYAQQVARWFLEIDAE